MSLPALLAELERRAITVQLRPDGNIFVRPSKAVPSALRKRLRAEKPTISAYLRAREAEIGRLASADADPYERARYTAKEAEDRQCDLVDYLREEAPDLLAESDDRVPRISPGLSLINTCQRYGIALWRDEAGALVLGKADGSGREPGLWPSLLIAIEEHVA